MPGAPSAIATSVSSSQANRSHSSESVRAVMKPIYIEMGILQSPSEPAFEEHAGSN
jgi:hypothetical protein